MFKIGVKNPKPRSKSAPEEFVNISVKPLELVWTKLRDKVKRKKVQVVFNDDFLYSNCCFAKILSCRVILCCVVL